MISEEGIILKRLATNEFSKTSDSHRGISVALFSFLKALHDSQQNGEIPLATQEKYNNLLRSLDTYSFEIAQISNVLKRCNKEMETNLELQSVVEQKNANVEKTILTLQNALVEQQQIRSNHQEYENFAKNVNSFQTREQLHSLLNEMDNQARVVREETEELSSIIQSKKKKIDAVLSLLSEIQQVSGSTSSENIPLVEEEEEEMSHIVDDSLE